MEGIVGIEPRIKKVEFESSRIKLILVDGREIIAPLKYYPSIKKVPLLNRSKYVLMDGGLAFDIRECDEIYHVRDFLGIPADYMKSTQNSKTPLPL